MRSKSVIRGVSLACALMAFVASNSLTAKQPLWRLGEIDARRATVNSTLQQAFERTVRAEFSHLPALQSARSKQFTVSTSLLSVKVLKVGSALQTSCIVSTALRQSAGGNLEVIVRGRARQRGQFSDLRHAKIAVIRAATQRAFRRLPDVVAR